VVLDYAMPEMCGDVLASRMKHIKPDVPLMLLSADDHLGEEVLDQVDMFLSKREPPRKFVEAVEDLLARSEDRFSKWLRDWKSRLAA
jgi:DNA-binding NarL/FixJ family response regulator